MKEADVLSGTTIVFSATQGTAFTGTVARFTDTDTISTASDFFATIDWGDGTTTSGVVSGSAGAFQVSGTHTYANYKTYNVIVTLNDDAPGTATASVTSTANVAPAVPAIPAPLLSRYGAIFLILVLSAAGLCLIRGDNHRPL